MYITNVIWVVFVIVIRPVYVYTRKGAYCVYVPAEGVQ